MIPIGARALEWIAKYLEQARPRLATAPDDGTLFLTSAGEPFAKDHLSALVAGSVQAKPLRSAHVEPAICSGIRWRR